MKLLIKSIREVHDDLQKGRGPDKKPRKKRMRQSPFMAELNRRSKEKREKREFSARDENISLEYREAERTGRNMGD